MKNRRFLRPGLALSAAAMLAALVTSQGAAFASSSAHKVPKLSDSSIVVQYLPSDDVASFIVAKDKGFWKQRGLTVQFLDTTGGTSANNVAGLVSGSYQAAIISPQALIALASADPQVRSLMATNVGGNDEIAINQGFATAHNIPSSGSTATGAVAQLNALKGSHLPLAFSTLTSTSFDDMLAVFHKYGITYSINGSNPSADVLCNSVGTSGALQSAVLSGKDQALVNNPPVSVVAGTIVISIKNLLPVKNITSFDLVSTTSFIQQHPDTLQALVSGAVQGMQYSMTHQAEAAKDMVAPLAASGTTSPETVDYIMAADFAGRAASPQISRVAFAADVTTASAAAATPYAVSYSNFVNNKFIVKAMKDLNYKVK